jgi:hypothetical protein
MILYLSKKNIQKSNLKNKLKKNIIIIRNFVDIKNILTIKKIINSEKKNLDIKFFYPKIGSNNLYIYNKLNPRSKVLGFYKKIEFYPWLNKNAHIFSLLKKEIKFLLSLLSIFDKKSNSNTFSYKKLFNKKKFIKLQVMIYPAYKGFLSKHRDTLINDKIIFSIVLQKLTNNRNVKKEGLKVFIKKKYFFLDRLVNPGDLVLFLGKFFHEVKKSNNQRASFIIAHDNFKKFV